MQKVDLDQLKRAGALWQGRGATVSPGRLQATGWPVFDDLLGGGWPCAALVELISDAHQGLPLLLPLLADLGAGDRRIAWVAPPYVPYAPALAARGVAIDRLLLVRDVAPEQSLWAAEQALKSAACSAVLAWPPAVRDMQLRRLQLAAERGGCTGFLFRPSAVAAGRSPAVLRLLVRPAPTGFEVELLKRRGGRGGARCLVPVYGVEDRGSTGMSAASSRPRPGSGTD